MYLLSCGKAERQGHLNRHNSVEVRKTTENSFPTQK